MKKGMLALCFGLYSIMACADAELVLEGAWVRALPPMQPNTAAYLTLHNTGDRAVIVVSATSPVAEKVEIHTTREVEGLMSMQQLRQLRVAPGERRVLSPGGTHLMLLGLERMPVAGEEVQLCLQLASGGEACTVAPAHKAGPADEAGDHQHHH